jgi:hypothetical protein
VEIRFSRHAKRRADLYGIPQSTIINILREEELSTGTHELIRKIEGFKHPLKIVIAMENDKIKVITAYPLKRGFGK